MHTMNRTKRLLFTIFFALFFAAGFENSVQAAATMPEVAIKGFDSVAYFQVGKALKGKKVFNFKYHGLVWYFLSAQNRDLFAGDPEKFAPQYDGYCAWAMTEQRKAITDPEVWKIVDGKLYLNCSWAAYEKWSRDIPGNIKKADANWQKMQNQ